MYHSDRCPAENAGTEKTQVCGYSLFHISENGYTLTEPEILIDTGSQPELLGQDLDAIVEQELGGQQALNDFAWSPIQPAE